MSRFNLHRKPTVYNQYRHLLDFVSAKASKRAVVTGFNSCKIEGVKLLPIPPELVGKFGPKDRMRVFINGVDTDSESYTYEYLSNLYEINFLFDLPYNLEPNNPSKWEIFIVGKFLLI